MQPKKWNAMEVGCCVEQRPRCVAASLSMLIVATLLFLAFFPGGGGVYRWWSCQDGRAAQGEFLAHDAAHAPTTLSHIMFGIGASTLTWEQRRGYAELWWRPDAMRGHVWLDEQPLGPWPAATCPPYRVSADASRFGNFTSASRMARIVVESFLAVSSDTGAGGEVRWFVMGDDDTVFFPDNLVAVLRKYDHEEMYYVGAPSESVEQNVRHSYGMAFGGGGFAVSYPAAAELAKAMDGCLERYSNFYGSDERVKACLSELGIPLTREPGFHQVDIHGDAYGMLAAHPVAPLVSLHHLDQIEPIGPEGHTRLDAIQPLLSASRFDSARLLQQAFCYQHGPGYTWSVLIAWGYTVQLYSWAVAPCELEVPLLTFKTSRTWSDGPFVFNTRPSSMGPCSWPARFFLSRVQNGTGGGGTVTEYSVKMEKECDQGNTASTVHTVKVFAPKMAQDEWKRAPRRHCCKTITTSLDTVLEVQIRHCSRGEIATP
ncbi:unnamed protein product [Alopecurus aequalis]